MSEHEDNNVHTISKSRIQSSKSSIKTSDRQTPNSSQLTPKLPKKKKRKMQNNKLQRRNIVKELVIRICLSLSVFTYVCTGGLVFHLLESNYDDVNVKDVLQWKNNKAVSLATELRLVVPHQDVWYRTIHRFLDTFHRELNNFHFNNYGMKTEENIWTFKNSALFSLSLVTGTDNFCLAPQSPWSKVTIIIYTLIGLPLTTTWIILLGEGMASLWIWLFVARCHCHIRKKIQPEAKDGVVQPETTNCNKPSSSKQNKDEKMKLRLDRKKLRKLQEFWIIPASLSIALFLVYFVIGATVITFSFEHWALMDGIFVAFLTLATVGTGCFLPTYANSAEMVLKITRSGYFVSYVLIGYIILSFAICTVYKLVRLKFRNQKFS